MEKRIIVTISDNIKPTNIKGIDYLYKTVIIDGMRRNICGKTKFECQQKVLELSKSYFDTNKKFDSVGSYLEYFCSNYICSDTTKRILEYKMIYKNVFLNKAFLINDKSIWEYKMQDIDPSFISAYFSIIYNLYSKKQFEKIANCFLLALDTYKRLYESNFLSDYENKYCENIPDTFELELKEVPTTYIPSDWIFNRLKEYIATTSPLNNAYNFAYLLLMEVPLKIEHILNLKKDNFDLEEKTLFYKDSSYDLSDALIDYAKITFPLSKDNEIFIIDGKTIARSTYNGQFVNLLRPVFFPLCIKLSSFYYKQLVLQSDDILKYKDGRKSVSGKNIEKSKNCRMCQLTK